MSTDTKYIFNESARHAILAAEAHLGPETLHKIFTIAFANLPPVKIPKGATDATRESLEYHDKMAASIVLQRLRDAEDLGVIVNFPGDGMDEAEVTAHDPHDGEGIDGKVFCDIFNLVRKAAEDDLTGFVLEALQLNSRRPISIGEADIISTYIDECKNTLGVTGGTENA